MKLKPCSKEEFDAFIAGYPREIHRDILRISTPDKIQYNDFTLGVWPESVVASHDAWGHTPGDIWGADPGGWRIAAEREGE